VAYKFLLSSYFPGFYSASAASEKRCLSVHARYSHAVTYVITRVHHCNPRLNDIKPSLLVRESRRRDGAHKSSHNPVVQRRHMM